MVFYPQKCQNLQDYWSQIHVKKVHEELQGTKEQTVEDNAN